MSDTTIENFVALEIAPEAAKELAARTPKQSKQRKNEPAGVSLGNFDAGAHDGVPYLLRTRGELKIRVTREDKNGNESWRLVKACAGHFRVIGRGIEAQGKGVRIAEIKDPATGGLFKLLLRNCDVNSRDFWSSLQGWEIGPAVNKVGREALVEYILNTHLFDDEGIDLGELPFWDVVTQPGWYEGNFILPTGEVISPTGTDAVKFITAMPHSPTHAHCEIMGTIESWEKSVGAKIPGNDMLVVGLAAHLSGPLLKVLNARPFTVHLYAQSSKGKTLASQVGASIYGSPAEQEARIYSWNQTMNYLLAMARINNDMAVVFDELHTVTDKQLMQGIYSLGNGVGRGQCNADGTPKEQVGFTCCGVSTGETDFPTHVRHILGIDVPAGALVRTPNIPHTGLQNLHGFRDAATFAQQLTTDAMNNHGAVGRKWIQQLVDDQETPRQLFIEVRHRWAKKLEGKLGQVSRVARHFQVMETALLMFREHISMTEEEVQQSIDRLFALWLEDFTPDTGYTREETVLLENLDAFLAQSTRFGIDRLEKPLVHTGGELYGYVSRDGKAYYGLPDKVKAKVFGNMKTTVACEFLHRIGRLEAVSRFDKSKGKTVTRYINKHTCMPFDKGDYEAVYILRKPQIEQ